MVTAQKIDDLVGHNLRLGGIHINLVHHRNDLKPVVHSQIKIGDRLRLDSLRRIDNKQRSLAGSYRAGDLVGEIHVARSVDQVKDIFLTFINIFHLDGVALDGDSLLPLQVHIVQNLRLHIPGGQCLGQFNQPVGKSALSVIDVGDDAEISYVLHIVPFCCWPSPAKYS